MAVGDDDNEGGDAMLLLEASTAAEWVAVELGSAAA